MGLHHSRFTRRSFLHRGLLGASGLWLASQPSFSASEPAVRKVHVIFKTHLDVGFTDMAGAVVDKYVHEFLPKAMRLARETREHYGPRRFKWTTGAWLIHHFLEEADPAARKALEESIASDEIVWHALPFTLHAEVIDAPLFEAGLQLSKRLDGRFGKATISAKMTDMPCCTRAAAPLLKKAGVQLLHVGVNPACPLPDVPPVFRWEGPDGSRIIVMYQQDYGGVTALPGTDEAMALLFTGDNHGPQTSEQIVEAYARLQARFPEATLVASDLNAVAATLASVSEALPAVSQELGDSWVHGVGSDPLKMAQLKALSRQRRLWLDAGALQLYSEEDLSMAIPLLMVAEHTWGLDVKTHLQAWTCYKPEDLAAARGTAPFARMEASWQEKRAYISQATARLSERLLGEARALLEGLRPTLPDYGAYERMADPGETLETPFFTLALDPETGALRQARQRSSGRDWASAEHPLALFAYQNFSSVDYDRFLDQYLRARPDWALQDLGKPGLEAFDLPSATRFPRLIGAWRREDEAALHLLAELELVLDDGGPWLGCPPRLTLEYVVSKTEASLEIVLQWFGKRANRLPEALWLSFVPEIRDGGAWTLEKLGQPINPRDVVKNGGHKLHGVDETIWYKDDRNSLTIAAYDAILAAVGERSLLNFDNAVPSPEQGVHFCLCNNVWGTNYVMWFDDDMRFRFRLSC